MHVDDEKYELRTAETEEEARQAAGLEAICFPPGVADSFEHVMDRYHAAPNLFYVAVSRDTEKVVAMLDGIATDENRFRDAFFEDASLHQGEGENVMLTGLSVLPGFRNQGIARGLMELLLKKEKENGRKMAFLTCEENKIAMYSRMGFVERGLSDSVLGGQVWYEMTCTLNSLGGIK